MSGPHQARAERGPADLSEALLKNLPPQNIDAERAVLAGVLGKPALLDRLAAEVKDSDFYSPAHAAVWRAGIGLWQGGKPVDVVSVAQALTAAGELDAAGGPAYLAELTGSLVAPSSAPHHAGIVREMAKRRAMLRMAQRMAEIAYDPERDPGDFTEIAARASEAVLSDRLDTHGESPAEFLSEYMAWLEHGEDAAGVPTPFGGLNKLIGGVQPGELGILAGRPSDGKTAMALQFAEHALREGKTCGIFSLEMSRNKLLNRMFSAATEVAAGHFRHRDFGDGDWAKIYEYANTVKDWPLRIYTQRARTPSEIKAACRRWRREMGRLDLIIIDYAQLLEPDHHCPSREQEVAAISRSLKLLAEDVGTAELLLAQVNREVEKRKPARLIASDLRESGALEHDADLIMLIQPWRFKGLTGDVHPTTLTVAKGRDTGTGDIPIAYNEKTVHFETDFRRTA